MSIKILSKKINIEQEQDDFTPTQYDTNTMTIETCDGGAGEYFVIETTRWAFDDFDALCAELKKAWLIK